jgi:hypothetical protein
VLGEESVARLVSKINRYGDGADEDSFDRLVAQRTSYALAGIMDCLDHVSTPWAYDRLCSGLAGFHDVPKSAGQVRSFLVTRAKDGRRFERVSATRALCSYWPAARHDLERIARTHKEQKCRQVALRPLVHGLRLDGGRDAIELLLETYRFPDSGDRRTGVDALRGFTSKAAFEAMLRQVQKAECHPQTRGMIFDALGGNAALTARDALLQLLNASHVELRLAALDALMDRAEGPPVERLETLTSEHDPRIASMAILALARIEPDNAEDSTERNAGWLRRRMDASRHRDPQMRAAAAMALASAGQDGRRTLRRLLEDPERDVRASAIDALALVRERTSIELLLDRFAHEEGELLLRIQRALIELSGVDHGRSAARWRAFWDAEGEDYVLPSRAQALAKELERQAHREQGPTHSRSFHGLSVKESRIALVLDTSASMAERDDSGETRLQQLERELRRLLGELPETTTISLIRFADDVDSWGDGMQPLNASSRRRAIHWVGRLRAVGETALYDGMLAALDNEELDAIYLLSDGDPTRGQVTNPERISIDIGRRAKLRGIKIHTLSHGGGSSLLLNLARETGGRYQSVK